MRWSQGGSRLSTNQLLPHLVLVSTRQETLVFKLLLILG